MNLTKNEHSVKNQEQDLNLKILAFCMKEGKVAARQIAREFGIGRRKATQIVRTFERHGICRQSEKKNAPYQLVSSETNVSSKVEELTNQVKILIENQRNPVPVQTFAFYDDRYVLLEEIMEDFNRQSKSSKDSRAFMCKSNMFWEFDSFGFFPKLFYWTTFKKVKLLIFNPDGSYIETTDFAVRRKKAQWLYEQVVKTFLNNANCQKK